MYVSIFIFLLYDWSSAMSAEIHLRVILQEMLTMNIHDIILKIINLALQPHGTNELLVYSVYIQCYWGN